MVDNAETKETLELFFVGSFHPWRMEGRYVSVEVFYLLSHAK